MVVVGAFIAGLMGSPHCAGMCGPFAAAHPAPLDLAAWNGGRLLAYTVLGALAGGLGERLPVLGAGFFWVIDGVLIVLALRLAGLVPEIHLAGLPGARHALAWAAKAPGWAGRVLFGAATTLLPCGVLWAALGLPLASGSALLGALAMLAFGLGTTPLLVAVGAGVRQLTLQAPKVRWVVAGTVLATGLWAVHGRPVPDAEGVPSCHHEK